MWIRFALAAFYAGAAPAQSNLFEQESAQAVRGGTSAFWDFEKDRPRWQGPAIIAATSLGAYAVHRFADQPLGDSSADQYTGGFSRALDPIGAALPLALPAAFFSAALMRPKDSADRDDLMDTARALVHAVGFTTVTTKVLKHGIERERPNGENDLSFPSGHSSGVFAVAGVLAQRYPWYVGAPSLAIASAVAYSRMDLNKHYFSDVVAGAGIGMLFATSASYANFQRGHPRAPAVAPMLLPDGYGINLAMRF